MLAFPSMLITAAKDAHLPVPPDVDDFEADEFPHFHVFCQLQLCRSMHAGDQFINAEVLSNFTGEALKTMTLDDFREAGFIC